MDFNNLIDANNRKIRCPYAGKLGDEWVEGDISVEFLNENFGQYSTATEMKKATESEGLQKFFGLLEQGKLQM